jgi:DNA-binding response OmpR family regulator
MAKILIIDADQSIIGHLSQRLGEEGHAVVGATDGSSGPMVASRERPDLIILEFHLPAANGAIVHERLRGNDFTAATPVIFLTAAPADEIRSQIKADELTCFLQKPVEFGLLAKTIIAFLPRAGPAPPSAAPPPAPPPPSPPPRPKLYDPDSPPSISGDVLDLD